MPARAFTKEFLRSAWWTLFTSLIENAVDDSEDLLRMGRSPKAIVSAASAIADAAIDEFENRWAE